MAIFGKRRDRGDKAEADAAPRTLLDESSPYGSRRVLVATNGTETWAQLFDGAGRQVTALWLAAHRGPAPDIQLSVPPEATRNPGGRPTFGHVEAVWFEEGDGVALFDNEGMLAVLPGWAGPETLPGYSREAVAPSPSAAPLHSAIDQFGPRAERARGYWTWRSRPEAWQEYQTDVQRHLNEHLGQVQQTVPLGESNPFVLAARFGTTDEHLAVTIGMSGQRMPAVEQFVDDPSPYARIELAVAGLGAQNADFVLLRWLARHPWRAATWIGNGHTVRWPGQGFPAGAPFSGVLLLEDPTLLPGPPAPDLSGHAIFGDPVRYLWLVPITDDDLTVAKAEGRDRLLARLRAAGRSWVAGDAGKPVTSSATATGAEQTDTDEAPAPDTDPADETATGLAADAPPADSTDPTDLPDLPDATAATDPTDSTDPAASTDPTDPAASTDATDSTDPAAATDLTDSTDSAEPTSWADLTSSTDPAEPTGSGTGDSTDWANSTDPTDLASSTDSAEPTSWANSTTADTEPASPDGIEPNEGGGDDAASAEDSDAATDPTTAG